MSNLTAEQQAEFVEAVLAGREVRKCYGKGLKWCGRSFVSYHNDSRLFMYVMTSLCPLCALSDLKLAMKNMPSSNWTPEEREACKVLVKRAAEMSTACICPTCGTGHVHGKAK
jgi:hypothetical protein